MKSETLLSLGFTTMTILFKIKKPKQFKKLQYH